MSTLKVNKIRDTSGSADAIVLDPSGGVKMSGICTATTFDGSATSLTQIPAANLVGVCTSGFTKTGGFGKFASYAVIADVKSSNADGGTFTLGAWRTRDLNTELSDADGIVSISSNQFTLAAGSYLIIFSATALRVGSHQLRLYNITSSAAVQSGIVEYAAGGSGKSGNTAKGSVRVVISSSTVFEIQHRGSSTQSSYGFGAGSSGALDWGGDTATDGAMYCIVEIYKEA
tara:strand:- start:45 stop:734 length:690 start_codon:yes stop_codon:yes gene_type:complete